MVIQLAHEAGLIEHAVKAALFKQELKKIDRYRKGSIKSKKLQVIQVQHVIDLFLFWFTCITLCGFTFTLEILIAKLGR